MTMPKKKNDVKEKHAIKIRYTDAFLVANEAIDKEILKTTDSSSDKGQINKRKIVKYNFEDTDQNTATSVVCTVM